VVIAENAAASRGTTVPSTELPGEASAANTSSPIGATVLRASAM
jgi:hypothetical protein